MKPVTVQEAFEIAIAAERAAASLFHGLDAKFADHENVAVVWQHYAQDEDQHAERLISIRSKVTTDQLAQQVDADTIALLQAVNEISVEKALRGVKDLEDAYQLVNEIESGETNAVFRFLLDNFEPDPQMRDFLRAQLNLHVARLENELPPSYRSRSARQAVKALH